MSFRADARRVQNADLSIWYRLVALRSCIEKLTWHSPDGYRKTLQRLDDQFGFNRNRPRADPPSEKQLLDALSAAKRLNSEFASAWRRYGFDRRSEKIKKKNHQRRLSQPKLFVQSGATLAEYHKAILKPTPTMVFFRASWDNDSPRMAVYINKLVQKARIFEVLVLDADSEENFQLYRDLKFFNSPILMVLQNGIEVKRRIGFADGPCMFLSELGILTTIEDVEEA